MSCAVRLMKHVRSTEVDSVAVRHLSSSQANMSLSSSLSSSSLLLEWSLMYEAKLYSELV